ncbi:MAG TPA: GNAT family N-acetyltransferase [Stellaceae bacterium]|nr:GNAT family N-acetyltransferase [Stellaceae bacterium]
MQGNAGPITVGTATETDVPGLIALINALAAEQGLLFISPIDAATGGATLVAHLAMIAKSGNETVILARAETRPVGLVTGLRGVHPARRGVVEMGIGVLVPWRGRGIGAALLKAVEAWARAKGCHRMQFPVVATNAPAIALYRKLGYQVEGHLTASAEHRGAKVDELLMAKLLG